MTERLTVEQVAQLRRFAADHAADTPTGREWLSRVRPVAAELVRLYSGKPVVQDRVERALALAAPLVQSPQARVTDEILHAVGDALTAIDESASRELRSVTEAARRELRSTGGKTLRGIFGF